MADELSEPLNDGKGGQEDAAQRPKLEYPSFPLQQLLDKQSLGERLGEGGGGDEASHWEQSSFRSVRLVRLSWWEKQAIQTSLSPFACRLKSNYKHV